MCLGSPLATELSAHSEEAQGRALVEARAAAERAEPDGGFAMSALVVTAR
jgi:hypothetical protein